MEWITTSKLYKGSKNQEKILAAFNSPLNKNLVRQLTSYVDEDYIDDEVDNTEVPNNPELEELSDNEDLDVKKPDKSKNSTSNTKNVSKASFKPSENFESHDNELENSNEDEPNETSKSLENKQDNKEQDNKEDEVEESTTLKSVASSTYVTVDTVSQAVNEIPGILNLDESTAGVTYTKLKGGSSNELWIYYNSESDINQVLDKVNKKLSDSGYYFLEFNRVSRDENAIIFSINWISNYFSPNQLVVEDDNA